MLAQDQLYAAIEKRFPNLDKAGQADDVPTAPEEKPQLKAIPANVTQEDEWSVQSPRLNPGQADHTRSIDTNQKSMVMFEIDSMDNINISQVYSQSPERKPRSYTAV